MSVVIAIGNAFEGLRLLGPFPDEAAAKAYMESDSPVEISDGDECQVVEIDNCEEQDEHVTTAAFRLVADGDPDLDAEIEVETKGDTLVILAPQDHGHEIVGLRLNQVGNYELTYWNDQGEDNVTVRVPVSTDPCLCGEYGPHWICGVRDPKGQAELDGRVDAILAQDDETALRFIQDVVLLMEQHGLTGWTLEGGFK